MTTEIQSASALYALADSLQSSGRPATEACRCAACGRHIDVGELTAPATQFASPATFTKWAYLSEPHATVVCWQCAATAGDEYQSGGKKAKSFACMAGTFPLHRGVDIARFVLMPPTPPFAAVFSTRQKQAMVFRAPLNLNRDYLQIRFDDDVLTIRVARVQTAVIAWREITALCATKFGNQPPISPIGVLSMNLEAAEVGKLHDATLTRLRHMGRTDLIAPLQGLSIGETWALSCTMQLDPNDPLAWRAFGQDA